MSGSDQQANTAFLDWFCKHGGQFDERVKIVNIENMGRGAQAGDNIPEGTILFSIPRSLVLSTATATLPSQLPPKEWASLNATGWSGLILCLCYEYIKGKDSLWYPYFAIIPETFETLIFWSEEDLAELQASLVKDKIGREEAEANFREVVKPIIDSRPEIFGDASSYTIELFHRVGSSILSRSFTVEPFESDDEQEDAEDQSEIVDEAENANMSIDSAPEAAGEEVQSEEEGEDEDEGEPVSTVGMVPFADILNAKSGCNNARLFYEKDTLNMVATENIAKGEQIYNTYAEPPNSDLLRRYGHVDEPNEHDIVELPADLVVNQVCSIVKGVETLKDAKVDWALEQGFDDVFSLSNEDLIPDELLSYILLFACSQASFDKIVVDDELPKPQHDAMTLKLFVKILKARLAQYGTSIEEDEGLLEQPRNSRHRNAIIVRMGEKRLLQEAIERAQETISGESGKKSKKRKAEVAAPTSSSTKRKV